VLDGIELVFWGGIFGILTAASLVIAATYYVIRGLSALNRRRSMRPNNEDSHTPS